MITVKQYTAEHKHAWDEFVANSKNGTFMLHRDYMEYHQDRFTDFSLLFYDDEKLIALLPACIKDSIVYSHMGLTYGGFITGLKMTASKMLNVFEALKTYLLDSNIIEVYYKCMPKIYHTYFADEDLYALFKNGAQLVRRDISTAICLKNKLKFSDQRKRGIKKALKNNLEVRCSNDYISYIDMLNEILKEYHQTSAVHTAKELEYLACKFPNNIKLFCCFEEEKLLAGVVIFETEQTAHAQYIANSNTGKNLGALDLTMDYLINLYGENKLIFDFGISTEQQGTVLNEGLINQKEGFGGRAVCYDTYRWSL